MVQDDKFEFLNVQFTREEAQAILEAAGYTNFAMEWGRDGGWQVHKLCCDHPEGKRMFAEYAWKKERDAMIKRLLLQGVGKKELPG